MDAIGLIGLDHLTYVDILIVINIGVVVVFVFKLLEQFKHSVYTLDFST